MPKAPKVPQATPVPTQVAGQVDATGQLQSQAQGLNTIGQDNPIGNLTYTTSIDPITGQLKYQANTSYSPDQQAILDSLERQKQGLGSTGENMISNASDMYSAPPDLVAQAQSIIDPLTGPMNAAWERFMAPERAQRRTALLNQGIQEDSPTYQLEADKLTNQQMLTKGQWLAQMEPAAFQQAQSQYEEPMNIISKIMGMSSPADLKSSFIDTPKVDQGSINVPGIYQSQLDAQMKAYEAKVAQQNAMMGMFTGLAKAIVPLPMGGFNPLAMEA